MLVRITVKGTIKGMVIITARGTIVMVVSGYGEKYSYEYS